jgi:hypothetical protein
MELGQDFKQITEPITQGQSVWFVCVPDRLVCAHEGGIKLRVMYMHTVEGGARALQTRARLLPALKVAHERFNAAAAIGFRVAYILHRS